MQPSKVIVNELKHILENVSTPGRLDNHQWTQSPVVRQRVADDPALGTKSPGYQLLAALGGLFHEMMPGAPPRRGKRLDAKWGQFGILAALYFAPLEFGAVRPASLRDAWGRIDQVIPLFVFAKPGHELPETDLNRYRLISDEEETAPISTISGWHIRGLERLAQSFLHRQQHLSAQLAEPEPAVLPAAARPGRVAGELVRRYWRPIGLALALTVALFLGWRAWSVYRLARRVQADVAQLQPLAESLAEARPALAAMRPDLLALQTQVRPFLWLGRLLGWVPVVGPDLAAAGDLLELAAGLATAADEAYQGGRPIWQATPAEPAKILDLLVEAQPHFSAAGEALDRALVARAAIQVERLSPPTRRLILEEIDPYLPPLQEGVAVATAAPKVLGASDYGPQTYLLLLQNEEELRPSGGFITAVGVVTIEGGQVTAFTLEDSYALDDPSRPYPPAPWQLDEYMGTPSFYLRDANWSSNFPTVAAWAEHLYVYSRSHAVDGVIAADGEVLYLLLTALGPIQLEDASQPGSAGERQRLDLTNALLIRLRDNPPSEWADLGRAALQALEERHLLIYLDDPTAAAVLANRGWDGALRPGLGDYLMVVDTNMGFNRANAAVQVELLYQVDLSRLDAPTSALTVTHRNLAAGNTPCQPGPDNNADLVARCYWDYLRVYTLAQAELLGATPHAIPAEWMVRGRPVPARVDHIQPDFWNPNIEGGRTFGTLLVAPPGETLETGFQFALPAQVVTATDENQWSYQLRVQKQPGTLATPLAIQVYLPQNAQVVSATPEGATQDNVWQAELALDTGVEIKLTFHVP